MTAWIEQYNSMNKNLLLVIIVIIPCLAGA